MNELSKIQYCIIMRNGMQIWVDQEKAEKLQNALAKITESKFINFENKTLNSADITGVFPAKDMDEYIRIKRGEWKCKKGFWHAKNEECPGHREVVDYTPPTVNIRASQETVDKVRKSLKDRFIL